MKARLLWTKRALSRVDAIGNYLSESNPLAARDITQRLHIAAMSLRDFPLQGRSGRVKATRELVLADAPYVIVYRQTPTSIEILTVMHTSQRWPKRF